MGVSSCIQKTLLAGDIHIKSGLILWIDSLTCRNSMTQDYLPAMKSVILKLPCSLTGWIAYCFGTSTPYINVSLSIIFLPHIFYKLSYL